MQKNQHKIGDKVTVRTRKEFAALPNTFARKKAAKHLHGIDGENSVFMYDVMQHLCGCTFTVKGINRKGKYIIHDGPGNVFTLTDWMLTDNV